MSTIDQVEAFAAGIIARDVPTAAPRRPHPRLWAYLDHRTMAEVAAAEMQTPFQRHVEGCLIDARATVCNPAATPSQRQLAARVIARWGMSVEPPRDFEPGGAA